MEDCRYLHAFKGVCAVLEAGRGRVDRDRAIWLDLGRTPAMFLSVLRDEHMVGHMLQPCQRY